MTARRLVLWITFASIFAMAARISVDTDTWWHLRTGEWILENGRIPQNDPFSYTRFGEPWHIPGWLIQVPMTWMYRAGGPGLLNLWVAAMVTLAFWLVYRVLEGGVFSKAFILILGAAAAGVYWAARPYMLTFVLAAAFLSILEDWRSGRADRLWWLPVLMVVWANGHGGFAVGFIIYGVYFAGAFLGPAGRRVSESAILRASESTIPPAEKSLIRRIADSLTRKLVVVGVALIIAVSLNPAGPEMLLYPFKTVGIEALQEYIQEWQSPNFHERQVWPFAAQLFLLIGAVGFSGKKLSIEDFLLVSGFGFLGLVAGRNISIFALTATIALARHAGPVVGRLGDRLGVRLEPDRPARGVRAVLNAALAVVILLAAAIKAASVYPAAVNEAHFAEILPVEAIEHIRETRPPSRLFNAYNWGAYLLWALPEYPVFVDGRTDLYDDEIIGEWFTVVRAEPGWEVVLGKWDVNTLLIEPYLPIAAALEAAGWTRSHDDGFAAVFIR